MKKILNCLLCDNSLKDSPRILIKNIPESAQGFEKNEKIKSNFAAYLFQCNQCNHVQLGAKPVKYYKEVVRSVGISRDMNNFRINQLNQIKKNYFNNEKKIKVLEIGSASGEYSKILLETFNRVVSTEKDEGNIKLNIEKGIECINTHPDEKDFLEKLYKFGQFDLICCFSYLEHLPNPKHTLGLLNNLLSDDGLYLIELPNSEMIFRRGLLNEIIPDHLSYFTNNTATSLMDLSGIEVINSSTVWDNYIISLICRKMINNPLKIMEENYEKFKTNIKNLFQNVLENNLSLVIWGAGHQSLFTISTTILNNITSYIIDSSPMKQDMFAPGSSIKVYNPKRLITHTPQILIIACAGYNNEVLNTFNKMNLKIEFVYLLNGTELIQV